MRISKLFIATLVSMLVSTLFGAQTVSDMGSIYTDRCANCHGVTANGVPKIKEAPGVKAEEADASGVASQEKTNIYGPALNKLSKEEIVAKLMDLRSKGFDTKSYHSVMKSNLKTIEAREGKISDEKMAEYIYSTFGAGAE
jgi:cytochrome c553